MLDVEFEASKSEEVAHPVIQLQLASEGDIVGVKNIGHQAIVEMSAHMMMMGRPVQYR